MLDAGDPVPSFDLESDDGSRVTAKELEGKRFVVYFYPKDSTPGCTVEAIDFSREKARFDALGVTVLGVSKDSIKSHRNFREKNSLTVKLLSDPELSLHQAFGSYGEKVLYGKKIMGTIRSTFLVGADGKIEKAWKSVKVKDHVEAVLAAVGAPPKKTAPATEKASPPAKKPAKKPSK